MQRDRLWGHGVALPRRAGTTLHLLRDWQRGTPVLSTSTHCSMTNRYPALTGPLRASPLADKKSSLCTRWRSSSRAGLSPAGDDGRPDYPTRSRRPSGAHGKVGRARPRRKRGIQVSDQQAWMPVTSNSQSTHALTTAGSPGRKTQTGQRGGDVRAARTCSARRGAAAMCYVVAATSCVLLHTYNPVHTRTSLQTNLQLRVEHRAHKR